MIVSMTESGGGDGQSSRSKVNVMPHRWPRLKRKSGGCFRLKEADWNQKWQQGWCLRFGLALHVGDDGGNGGGACGQGGEAKTINPRRRKKMMMSPHGGGQHQRPRLREWQESKKREFGCCHWWKKIQKSKR